MAQSTSRSENVQSTPFSDHFWKFRSRKSARRCGAKHISKSKCTKHTRSGPLLEVQLSKKCTPLWREAHFEVKMYKTLLSGFGPLWEVQISPSLHYTTLHYTTLHYTALHYTTLPSTTLHYITPHYTPIHYNYNYTTTLHYNTLHYTKLHYTTLHYTTLNYTTLHYTTLHYLPLHFTTLHYTPLHYNYNYECTTTLHYSPLH